MAKGSLDLRKLADQITREILKQYNERRCVGSDEVERRDESTSTVKIAKEMKNG